MRKKTKRSNKQKGRNTRSKRQKGGFIQDIRNMGYSTADFFKGLNTGFAGVSPAPSSVATYQPSLIKGGCASCKMMGGQKRQTKKRQTKKRVRFADSRR
jgi:hypothetical protein